MLREREGKGAKEGKEKGKRKSEGKSYVSLFLKRQATIPGSTLSCFLDRPHPSSSISLLIGMKERERGERLKGRREKEGSYLSLFLIRDQRHARSVINCFSGPLRSFNITLNLTLERRGKGKRGRGEESKRVGEIWGKIVFIPVSIWESKVSGWAGSTISCFFGSA